MVQAKDPAAAPEKATVSGLRDGLLRSHALRGNVPGALRVRLVEREMATAGQNGYRLNRLIFTFLPPPVFDKIFFSTVTHDWQTDVNSVLS